MDLIKSVAAVTGPGQAPRMLVTFGVALLFAAVYLFGGRLSERLSEAGRRRFFSFAAGLSVSYVFVHLLPVLNTVQEASLSLQRENMQGLFPELSVYLSAMLGFLVFFGLESIVTKKSLRHPSRAESFQPWIYIGGFAAYTWLITFLSVRTGKSFIAMGLYALAMMLHFALIANRLRSESPTVYSRWGGPLLALASLAGWACGLTLHIPDLVVLDMVAIVAGGVIINAMISEIPKEGNSSYWFFFTGAIAYAALLLLLSYFENGEHS